MRRASTAPPRPRSPTPDQDERQRRDARGASRLPRRDDAGARTPLILSGALTMTKWPGPARPGASPLECSARAGRGASDARAASAGERCADAVAESGGHGRPSCGSAPRRRRGVGRGRGTCGSHPPAAAAPRPAGFSASLRPRPPRRRRRLSYSSLSPLPPLRLPLLPAAGAAAAPRPGGAAAGARRAGEDRLRRGPMPRHDRPRAAGGLARPPAWARAESATRRGVAAAAERLGVELEEEQAPICSRSRRFRESPLAAGWAAAVRRAGPSIRLRARAIGPARRSSTASSTCSRWRMTGGARRRLQDRPPRAGPISLVLEAPTRSSARLRARRAARRKAPPTRRVDLLLPGTPCRTRDQLTRSGRHRRVARAASRSGRGAACRRVSGRRESAPRPLPHVPGPGWAVLVATGAGASAIRACSSRRWVSVALSSAP